MQQRNLLIKIRQLKGRKQPKGDKVPGMLKQPSLGKQIVNIRNEIIDAKKASELAKTKLITKQKIFMLLVKIFMDINFLL